MHSFSGVSKRRALPEKAWESVTVRMCPSRLGPVPNVRVFQRPGHSERAVILASRTLRWLPGAGRDVARCGLAEVRTATRTLRAGFARPESGLPCHLPGEEGCCQLPSSGTSAVSHSDSSLRPAAVRCLTTRKRHAGREPRPVSEGEGVSGQPPRSSHPLRPRHVGGHVSVLWPLFKWRRTRRQSRWGSQARAPRGPGPG